MTITFTKAKLPFGWLGNMSPYPVTYLDKIWRNTESLFQALRFTDKTIQEEIRLQTSPIAAKLIANKYHTKMAITPKGAIDLENMELVLRLKLDQHPELKEALLKTKNEEIIEDVSNRPITSKNNHIFWGATYKNGQWIGENTLGKIWMKLREELNDNSSL